MNLTIFDEFSNKAIQVTNTAHIPRLGERVYMGYAPAPVVKEVVYKYETNEVMVKVSTKTFDKYSV